MEIIKHGELILAVVYKEKEWPKGLNFITPDELFIQASTWRYDKGKKLAAHIHHKYDRVVDKTHEVIFVRRGSVKVTLYDNNKKELQEFIAHGGDIAVLADGGHGYEILEDDTQILEVKNGPFISVEKDKEKF